MPLVDYASSGESSDEEKEKECETPVKEIKVTQVTDDSNNGENIFASLPKPKDHVSLDGKDQFKNLLLKGIKVEGGNKKEPAKITIPSLNDFDNDDIDNNTDASKPKPKKMKTSASSVGLFAVLPPPKNAFVKEANRQLIPHVVKNQLTKPKMKVSNTAYNTQIGENSNYAYFNSSASNPNDFEDQEAASSSYFGEGIANSSHNMLNEFDTNTPYTPTGLENFAHSRHLPDKEGTVNLPESYDRRLYTEGDPNAECNDLNSLESLELDEKAMHILCGGKRKRNQMPVNIIDLSGEEIMPDSKEWLIKQLTEESNVRKPNHKKSNGPSLQSRRKHQITYLAYQAKAQELELQNQWSNNRMSRRQTQSKYGF